MNTDIFNIAKSLFYEKGYSKTKISDITKKLGLVPANFYRHYSSKEELLREIISIETRDYSRRIKDFATKDNFQDKIKLVFKTNLIFIFEKPRLFALLLEIKSSKYKLDKSTLNLVDSISNHTGSAISSILNHSNLDDLKKRMTFKILMDDLAIFLDNLIRDSEGIICPHRISTLSFQEEFDQLFNLTKGVCYGLGVSNDIFSKIDPVTGLLKKEYFLELLAKSYDCLNCKDSSIEILYLKLENLDQKDEGFFHDNLLKSIGSWIRNSFRESDQGGILSDNTFALLLSNHSTPIFKIFLERCYDFEKILWKKYPALDSLKLDLKILSIKEGHSMDFNKLFSSDKLIEQNVARGLSYLKK